MHKKPKDVQEPLPYTLENTNMWTKDLDLVINFNRLKKMKKCCGQ